MTETQNETDNETARSAGRVRIAHLSDVHLGPLGPTLPWHWNVKRGLGYLNWLRKRRFIHDPKAAHAIAAHIRDQAPDHVLVSGDLANIGLPSELALAADWLASLGPPDRITAVPGNHDIYCPLWRDAGVARWAKFMQSSPGGMAVMDGVAPREVAEPVLPFVRIIADRIAVIGLNSAVPTPPGYAYGELGAAQLQRLDAVLGRLGATGHFRLVMLHHPPLPEQAPAHRSLRDAPALVEIVQRHGAELIVHGHEHVASLHRLDRAAGPPVPVVGVGSASAIRTHRNEPMASYNVYVVTPDPAEASGYRLEYESFGRTIGGGIERIAPLRPLRLH